MKLLLFVFWVLATLLGGCVQPTDPAQTSMSFHNDGENMLTELNYLYSIQFPAHWVFLDTDALNEQRRADWPEPDSSLSDIEIEDLQNTAMFVIPAFRSSKPEERTIPTQNFAVIYHRTSAVPFSRKAVELWENYTGLDFGELEQIYLDGVGSYRFTGQLPPNFSITYYLTPLPGNLIATFTMAVPDEYLEDMAAFHRAMETLVWIR